MGLYDPGWEVYVTVCVLAGRCMGLSMCPGREVYVTVCVLAGRCIGLYVVLNGRLWGK